ncbi:MAG: response regulator [Desulfobacula sp.]|nr:response regulator [Desulfobacula sp.]
MANSDLLNKYKIETLERCNQMVRFVTVFVMLGNPTFLILDFFQTNFNIVQFILVRSFMSIGMFIIYIIARTRYGIKYAMWLGVAACFVCSIDIIALVHMTGGSSSPYYAGLLIILFAICIWIPITYRLGLFCAVSIYSMYVFPFLVANTVNDWSIFLNNNYFIVAIFFLSVSSLKFYNDIRFNEFKSRYEIQKSNEELSKVTKELEESNKKLRELDKMKTRFFANVSHELRTPLTLILGPLEQLMQSWNEMDPVPTLRSMEANAHRLLRQVNTILDFTKADAGKLTCHYRDGNLGEILSELVRATIPYTEQKNIEMTISGTDKIPDTEIDVEKVETIAANLISNALKFTSDNGKISICTGQDKEFIWFEVQDTGMGIPEDKLDLIFERFLQVEDKHSRKNEGTGLGLAMVRELSLLHGGKINVRSKIGKGSTFRVELPMKPPSSKMDRREKPGRRKIDKIAAERIDGLMEKEYQERTKINKKTLFADVARGTGLGDTIAEKSPDNKKSAPKDAHKILVVEDNPDLRAFIVSNLVDTYQVEEAENGRKGLDLARRINPDLILSDVMMPEMDGYELCRQIRKDPFLLEVPIILVTSKSGGEAVQAGLEIGATDYVPKPFEIRELKARIAAHLKNRFLEKNISERETRLTAIGQMTSEVVHDLKNPLNSIMGFTQIAQQDSEALEEKRISKSLSLVMESSTRLHRMISEILDFARGYAPRLNTDSTVIVPFLETTLSNHRIKLKTMGISLISRYEACDNIQVEFDCDQIHRVIDNLVMNAKEGFFTGNHEVKEKIIWVTTTYKDNHAVIQFADNGPGIPEEIKNSLFDPFTSIGKKSGTGLGLATVRNIVTAHSGKITVESKGKEGGAVFELKFPASIS